jgi:two-component system chemotaxis response regulator CheY
MSHDLSMPILVVEDSNTMGRIICDLLKQLGFHKVDLTHGGTTALAKMRGESYGLVISDWNMQPITGLDLLKKIRSDTAFAGIRFIMITAETTMDNVIAAGSTGADGFIAKPFTARRQNRFGVRAMIRLASGSLSSRLQLIFGFAARQRRSFLLRSCS